MLDYSEVWGNANTIRRAIGTALWKAIISVVGARFTNV